MDPSAALAENFVNKVELKGCLTVDFIQEGMLLNEPSGENEHTKQVKVTTSEEVVCRAFLCYQKHLRQDATEANSQNTEGLK